MHTARNLVLAALLAGAPLMVAGNAHAAGGEITCKMSFEIHGWSAFYKTSSGSGSVTCSNGQHMTVHLRSKGGGLTFGKSSIEGIGKFSASSTSMRSSAPTWSGKRMRVPPRPRALR